MQRVQLLQEENDELYLLLRRSETGKLKEQVAGLTQTVERMESALQGARTPSYSAVISSASAHLDFYPHIKPCFSLHPFVREVPRRYEAGVN